MIGIFLRVLHRDLASCVLVGRWHYQFSRMTFAKSGTGFIVVTLTTGGLVFKVDMYKKFIHLTQSWSKK